MFRHRPKRALREKMLEHAVTITLLGVPEFREKAGLPPLPYPEERSGTGLATGEKQEVIARACGVSKQAVQLWELKAMKHLRNAVQRDRNARALFIEWLAAQGEPETKF